MPFSVNGFRRWAIETVGAATPAAVDHWFTERGVEFSREFWRKLLAGDTHPSIGSLITISQATGRQLSTLVDYIPPTSEPAAPRLRPKRKRRVDAIPAEQHPAPPPNLRKYFES